MEEEEKEGTLKSRDMVQLVKSLFPYLAPKVTRASMELHAGADRVMPEMES